LPFEGGEEGKFLLPVDGAHDAARLTAIVELGGADVAPRLEPLTGAAAMAVLSRHVVGRRKMRALLTAQQHFGLVGLICRNISVHRLHGRQSSSATHLARYLHDVFG
jgi:hypothetical protein